MEWHGGNLLSHTVFTLLYTQQLAEIEVDFMPPPQMTERDYTHPPELIYVVLRACVMGLLKCCDLSWRELSKNAVQDVCSFLPYFYSLNNFILRWKIGKAKSVTFHFLREFL